ncbi:MAG TPA: hypothetical protein G4O10_04445 [Dehalococcoidia bacterium]|nr:hypothetical protein [Dehalococcoidia bacterium]
MSHGNTGRRVAFIIGLIAALIIIHGVFSPWFHWEKSIAYFSPISLGQASGWDLATSDVSFGGSDITQERSIMPLLALGGGILSVLSAVGGLFTANRFLGITLALGGILTLVGLGASMSGEIAHYHVFEGYNEYIKNGTGLIECGIAAFITIFTGIFAIRRF